VADYANKVILAENSGQPVSDDQWIGCEPDELHELLTPVFEGDWGPSSVDTILRMERSGVRVELCGTAKFGPANPREFLENLRQALIV
jgi:hypothetical protein